VGHLLQNKAALRVYSRKLFCAGGKVGANRTPSPNMASGWVCGLFSISGISNSLRQARSNFG
jgi:hypothetical protein